MTEPNGSPRLRLLIVTRDRFPPFRVDLTELFCRWLTPVFDIDWVMRAEADGRAETVDGAPGERFLVSGPGVPAWLWLQLRQGVRTARGEAALAQVRDAAFSAVFFLLMARVGRRPFVYWMSYPITEGYRHRALRQTPRGAPWLRLARLAYAALAGLALYRLVLPNADHVFVQSERMRSDVAALGIDPQRITAVPMGVSVAAFDPRHIAFADDPRLEGRLALVYVGALDPERRIEMLAEAVGQVAFEHPEVMLVIIGAAGEATRRSIEASAAGVGDRLLFTGHLPLVEALGYVRRAAVCLSPFPVWPPTYLSATPTKLVEYLAMGRPTVASDHPDQRQAIEASGAGVIAPATASGFAAAILALLNDPEAAEAMGARGPAWAAAHRDYAVISEVVRGVYARLLRAPRP